MAAIIAECHSTLDLENGGDVAKELDRLYSYLSERLLDVNLKKDATALDEMHRLLTPVRNAFAEAAAQSVIAAAVPAAPSAGVSVAR